MDIFFHFWKNSNKKGTTSTVVNNWASAHCGSELIFENKVSDSCDNFRLFSHFSMSSNAHACIYPPFSFVSSATLSISFKQPYLSIIICANKILMQNNILLIILLYLFYIFYQVLNSSFSFYITGHICTLQDLPKKWCRS